MQGGAGFRFWIFGQPSILRGIDSAFLPKGIEYEQVIEPQCFAGTSESLDRSEPNRKQGPWLELIANPSVILDRLNVFPRACA